MPLFDSPNGGCSNRKISRIYPYHLKQTQVQPWFPLMVSTYGFQPAVHDPRGSPPRGSDLVGPFSRVHLGRDNERHISSTSSMPVTGGLSDCICDGLRISGYSWISGVDCGLKLLLPKLQQKINGTIMGNIFFEHDRRWSTIEFTIWLWLT